MKNCLECLATDIESDTLTCPFCGGGSWPDASDAKPVDAEKDASDAKPKKKRGDG